MTNPAENLNEIKIRLHCQLCGADLVHERVFNISDGAFDFYVHSCSICLLHSAKVKTTNNRPED